MFLYEMKLGYSVQSIYSAVFDRTVRYIWTVAISSTADAIRFRCQSFRYLSTACQAKSISIEIQRPRAWPVHANRAGGEKSIVMA